MDKQGYKNPNEKLISINTTENQYITDTETDENVNIEDLPKMSSMNKTSTDTNLSGTSKINSLSEKTKTIIMEGEKTGEIKTDKNALKSMAGLVNTVSNEVKDSLHKNNNPTTNEKKAVQIEKLKNKLSLFIAFLDETIDPQNDSDEFKDVNLIARKLNYSVERIKDDGNYPPDISKNIDALHVACILYNSKNRGTRHTAEGVKRQRNVAKMLSYLNFNSDKLEFMRPKDQEKPSISDLTKPEVASSFLNFFKKQEESPIDKALKKPIIVPKDLRFADKNTADLLSIEKTKADAEEIERLLKLPATELEKYAPEKIGALKMKLYRDKAHLLLNDNRAKGKEDSVEMKEVKESLFIVERLMAQKGNFNPNEDIEKIIGAYAAAISASKHYIKTKNPRTAEGKQRKKMVEENLSRLQEESSLISMAQSLIAVNATKSNLVTKPQDLLILANYHKGREDVIENAEKNDVASAYSLTLEDFIALAGSKNRGNVEFKDGKMVITENTAWQQTELHEILNILSGQDVVPTVANRQMKERLYEICCEKIEAKTPGLVEYLKNVKTILDLNNGAAKSLPVSREDIVGIVSALTFNSAKYKKTFLTVLPNEAPMEEKTSLEGKKSIIRNCLNSIKPKTVSQEDWNSKLGQPTKEMKKDTSKEVKNVLKSASKLGVRNATLDTHQLDNLVNHNLPYFIDRLYEAWDKVYRYAANFTNNKQIKINDLMTDKNISTKLTALVMLDMEATKEDEKTLRSVELNEYIKELALLKASPEHTQTQKTTSKMNIYHLSDKGSEGLETIVEDKLYDTPAFKGAKKMAKAKKGTRLLKNLCDNLQEISNLYDNAMEGNLSEEKAAQLKTLGEKVQNLLETGYDHMEFVAKELKSTRFFEGYYEAKRLLKSGYSFKDAAELLANTYVKHEKQENKPEEKKKTYTTNEKIALLSKDERAILNILRMEDVASSLVSKDNPEAIAFTKKLNETLRSIPKNKIAYRDLKIGDINFKLVQKEDNSLHVVLGGHAIPVGKTADRIANSLEEDMLLNTEIFGDDFVLKTLKPLDVSGENQGVLVRSRNLCIKYLAGKLKKPETFFSNVSSTMIKKIALDVVNKLREPDEVIRQINLIESKVHINGDETKELLIHIDKLNSFWGDSSNVTMPKKEEEAQKPGEWTKEQKQIVDLIADLIFSKDTWFEDYKEGDAPGSRIKNIISSNVEGMAELIANPKTLETILDSLPIDDVNMKQQIITDINGVLSNETISNLKKLDKSKVVASLKAGMVLPGNAIFSSLSSLEPILDKMANDCTNTLQAEIRKAAEAIFVNKKKEYSKLKDPNEKGISKEERKVRLLASKERLNQLLEDSIKGNEGQGKFLKNLLSNYFEKSSILDKRSMLSSAIRNSRPKTVLQIDENLPQNEKDELINSAKLKDMGNYLGGFLKGAGPLMQKELQGLPQSAIPDEIKDAIKDMKSNLAPIPDKIVKAQMQNIVERSNGKITRIVVNKALGAASVGQTFLCTFHGPEMGENGKETVVKLLRPDVRNRMEREKSIMLWCAKKTDGNIDEKSGEEIVTKEKGGMEATYEGKLLRIEEELDLSIEAKNAQKGTLYDRGFVDVKAMKVDDTVEPTTNSLVLEKAPGETVDKYLLNLKDLNKRIYSKYTGKNNTGTIVANAVTYENSMEFFKEREELKKAIATLRKRQKHMVNLTESWVTEGIYGEGFYHGDLHAGNIMIDDDKVTLIDFGNATKLNDEQIKHVTRMMMAAATGDIDIFEDGFHALMEKTSDEKYNAKKSQLKAIIKEVFALGDATSAGQRIAVALVRAQNLGLEVPPAIFNFSQSQIRLQDTLDTMNAQIKEMEHTLGLLYNTGYDALKQGLDPFLAMTMCNAVAGEKQVKDNLSTGIPLLETDEDIETMKNDIKSMPSTSFSYKYYPNLGNFELSSFNTFNSMLNDMISRKKEGNNEISFEANESSIKSIIELTKDSFPPVEGISFDSFQETVFGFLDQHSVEGYQKALEEINTLRDKISEYPSYNAYFELSEAYTKLKEAQSDFSQKKITKEQLDKLEADIQNKEQNFIKLRKEFLMNRAINDLASPLFKVGYYLDFLNTDGYKERLESMFKAWYENEDLDKNITAKIKEAFEDYKDYLLLEERDENLLLQKKNNLLLAMRPALLYRAKMAQSLMSGPLEKDEPDDFVDIMSNVININLAKSINLLGKWKAVKMRPKLKKG